MKVILIGNYVPDRQRSMAAFGELMKLALSRRDIAVTLITPPVLVNRGMPRAAKKWLGYVDKFIAFRSVLRQQKKTETPRNTVFHIVDHSNAMYVRWLKNRPCVVTCHDMLAVRAGLGEQETFCQASRTGRLLQQWILAGLKSANHIACVSDTTRQDLERLTRRTGDPGIVTVRNAINAPFHPLTEEEWQKQMPVSNAILSFRGYLLMVGSALPRKNRETALRAFSHLKNRWSGVLVIAGAPLTPNQRQLAKELGVEDRVIEVEGPNHQQLNALYSGALALLFPSYSEGFGWPITEANACDCPVLCSDRTSVPEVAGDSALIFDADDSTGFAQGVIRLTEEPGLRQELIQKGQRNLERFTAEKMLEGYLDLYEQALTDIR